MLKKSRRGKMMTKTVGLFWLWKGERRWHGFAWLQGEKKRKSGNQREKRGGSGEEEKGGERKKNYRARVLRGIK